MNWLYSRRNNGNLAEPTPLQTLRARQIERLNTFSVTEMRRDLEYWVQFKISAQKFDIVITLPPQFPHDKPMLQIKPPVRHRWLNEHSIITNCPALNDFAVHSDLGSIVRQILDEFQRNPPIPVPQPTYKNSTNLPYPIHTPAVSNTSYPSYPIHPVSTSSTSNYTPMTLINTSHTMTTTLGYAPPPYSNYNPPNYYNSNIVSSASQPVASVPSALSCSSVSTHQVGIQNSYPAVMMPDIPNNLPFIQEMGLEDLKEANENIDRYLHFLSKLAPVESLEKEKDKMLSQNEELAKKNLTVKPLLEDKKKKLLESFDLLNEAQSKANSVAKKQDELLSQYDSSTVLARLKVAISEADSTSEEIAEEFMSGKLSVDEYIRKYTDSRKLFYNRRAMEEKISKQL